MPPLLKAGRTIWQPHSGNQNKSPARVISDQSPTPCRRDSRGMAIATRTDTRVGSERVRITRTASWESRDSKGEVTVGE
jgi:hypothetical protein